MMFIPVASSTSMPRWWVAAWRPSSRPAIARASEPPHTVATVISGLASAWRINGTAAVSPNRASSTGMVTAPSSGSPSRAPDARGTTT
ncbi:hypothetical protein ACVWWN_003872 [Mycobacterium sp. URHB0021]